jgi:hypothetical protein
MRLDRFLESDPCPALGRPQPHRLAGWRIARPFPSSAHRASRISSILTGAISPSGARKAGQDAMADASDAHESRIARFFERLSAGSATTSRGWLNTAPCPSLVVISTVSACTRHGVAMASRPTKYRALSSESMRSHSRLRDVHNETRTPDLC